MEKVKIPNNLDQKQPSNIEAEQALLGSILVNNDIIDEVSNIINPTSFYDPGHTKIYEVIEKLISKGKAPVRISFAGGGTDLTNYFYKESGVVLNATINKFVNAVVEKRNDATIYIKSYDLNKEATYKGVDDIEFDGSLDLIKSVIKILKPEFGFNLFTYSDIPSGSGLGGSAALLSSVIGAFNNFRENKYTDYEISELSFHAERVALNLSGGWQDQYATVFGGFNYIEFKDHENIVNTLRISDEITSELEDSLLLCYSGICHDSNEIHNDQKKQMNNKQQKLYATSSKDIAQSMKARLLKGKLDDFGELLGQAWSVKKKFSSKIFRLHFRGRLGTRNARKCVAKTHGKRPTPHSRARARAQADARLQPALRRSKSWC